MRQARRDWRHHGPFMTKLIIAVCVAVWILEEIVYLATNMGQATAFARFVTSLEFIPALAASRPWMFLTSMFMHAWGADVWHIACNMVTLWVVGPELERQLGHWGFLALYLTSGLGGDAGLLTYARLVDSDTSWMTPSVGASGAIFGLFGSLLVLLRRGGVDYRSMLVMVVINLLLPLLPNVSNIAWQAHVGGLLTGLASTGMGVGTIATRRMWNKVRRTVMSASTMLVLILIVVLLCYGTSDVWPVIARWMKVAVSL